MGSRAEGTQSNHAVFTTRLQVKHHINTAGKKLAEPTHQTNSLEVAIGLIYDPSGKILIAKRGSHQELAGRWEFPGGKVEARETPAETIRRELFEELDIKVSDPQPCFTFEYAYPKKTIRFYVFEIYQFSGNAIGKENQPIQWIDPNRLSDFNLPDANAIITNTLPLPKHYGITPSLMNTNDSAHWMDNILTAQQQHQLRLIQFRSPELTAAEYTEVAKQLQSQLSSKRCKLILNCEPELAMALNADGVHLTQKRFITSLTERDPSVEAFFEKRFVSVACHDLESLQLPQQRPINCALVSPVLPTQTHPDAKPLGWKPLTELVNTIRP